MSFPKAFSAKKTTLAALSALALVAAGCSGNSAGKNDKFAYVEQPVEQLYLSAVERLQKKRYDEAVAFFGEVERQHPYSAWARRSMLMIAFAQYQQNDYDEALSNLQRFIDIHPGNKDAPYAYYLRAMCHYERIRDVGRDQDITLNAFNALTDVVNRYPDTEYARDARLKLDLTNDHLAGKEMDVGRWYLRRNQHVAAINRFDNVIKQYQTTSHVPEALHRLVESYLELGVYPEAKRHAAILGYNYQGSEWYEDTYKLFQEYGVPMMKAAEVEAAGRADQVAREAVSAPLSVNDVADQAMEKVTTQSEIISPPSDLPTEAELAQDRADQAARIKAATSKKPEPKEDGPVIEDNPDLWEK